MAKTPVVPTDPRHPKPEPTQSGGTKTADKPKPVSNPKKK